MSTQYHQIKSICAVNEQTLEFEFVFLIWYFCPLSHWSQRNDKMTKKSKRQMNFSKHANSEHESPLTNATSFNFLLYFLFAIELKE